MSTLDLDAVCGILEEVGPNPWQFHHLPEVDSTNDAARERYQSERRALAVFAETQSRGRGRRGNAWHSGRAGENLILSCAFAPAWSLPVWGRLTHIAALAVKRALDLFPPARPMIKWPNDVYLSGRKVCGILVDAFVSPADRAFAVVGFGINVNARADSFPDALRASATSLREVTGTLASREALAAALLSELHALADEPEAAFGGHLEELSEASWLLGRDIEVMHEGRRHEGVAVGLGDNGELRVRTAPETTIILTNAELVRRR